MILLIMLLLAGLAALGYAGSLLLQTKSFEVPVLAGVPEDEALNQIAGNGWEIDTLRERSDTFPEFDTVIRTRPGPGIELDEGEPFTLVLSNGPEFRTLPELEALPFDAAIAELAGLGLSGVEAPERLFSETVAPESVIAWQVQGDADGTMQAGAQILPGETIVMTLSMGPEPRIVPDLTGQTVQLATATLADLQLELARDDDLFSDTVPIGQTVSQNPAVGASLERNGTVTIQVSKGPDVVPFPDLTGQTFTDAQTLLTNTGYVIGSLLGTTEGRFVEATIDDADVLPGDLHRRGTPVDLIFL
ncbi:MAG: PASTA domain-containing protein [Ilumatobacter sp.]|nr:PASTA domain-containing protein [Ilumatobacter sp.]